ncbi:MAG TPA: hypothetical protein PLV62_06325, partial [Spirochaetota bacterium]|nr:hypothetical protein [Spirochaetota bacterium]
KIISKIFRGYGPTATVKVLDDIKELGYRFATYFGPTISTSDVKVPEMKEELIKKANEMLEKIENEYRDGWRTNEERYNRVIDLWTKTNDDVTEVMFDTMAQDAD